VNLALGSIAAAAIGVVALSAQAAPSVPPSVRIELEVEHGRTELAVYPGRPPDFRFGDRQQRIAVDPAAVRFTLRPYPGDRPSTYAPARAYRVRIGTPQPARNDDDVVHLPLALAAPPRPGMYLVGIEPGRTFVRSIGRGPAALIAAPGRREVAVWWPDERDGDAALRDVQTRFANRVVHGYGGIAVGCSQWSEQHGPASGVRLAGVTREVGTAALLHAGSLASSQSDASFRFLAIDPIVLQIADSHGTPYHKTDAPGSCDLVWRFADPWHVDTALTTAAPPAGVPRGFDVRVGMSRDDVVWRAGYPNVFGTVATLRAQNSWRYDAPAPAAWSVSFANDRVVHVDPPGQLP
jgi:hypothetical protein